ncbi:MAG: tetratricopeptide repeat protein, partial [Verrucomicrobiota bacterium]
ERAGGKWPQTEIFHPPPPSPTLAETRLLLETSYRDRLAALGGQMPENGRVRQENLVNLADLLRRQGRFAEAEPYFRELLTYHKQRTPRDDKAALSAAKSLLSVYLALMRTERESADPGRIASYAQQADALVSEVLAMMTQSTEANLSLKVAALQVWFGRDADHLAMCRSLIEQAEKDSANTLAVEHAAKALCYSPSPDPALLPRALHLARLAADLETNKLQRGWYQQTLGMAEFRSGNDAAAEQAMLRSEEASEISSYGKPYLRTCIEGTGRFYRAMVLWRQGKDAEARKLFAEAEVLVPSLPNDPREVLLNGVDQDDLVFWLAYKEAKAQLQPPADTAPPEPAGK